MPGRVRRDGGLAAGMLLTLFQYPPIPGPRVTSMKVDLTLAVNYVPACMCLCKALALMLGISLIQPGEEVRGGYIPLAAMLYLDRLIMRNMIFDANAILLAVYFANVHAVVRATSIRTAYPVFMMGLHLCWVAMSLTLLAEPGKVRWYFEKRVQASRLVPVLFMLLVIVPTAYVHEPFETGAVRACRALTFTLLAFAWIYLVGIHTSQGIEYLKETSCQFTARLAPLLYSPLWVAGAFFPAAIGALAWYHFKRPPAGYDTVQIVVTPHAEEPKETDPDDVQLFRQAKGRLEVVPE